jgi:hypothetical protein
MTDRTENRGYPYPECSPPLVKDASDIADLRDLAEAVNSDAVQMNLNIQEFVEKPDAARIAFAGNVTVTGLPGFSFLMPYNVITYDNTGLSTDLSEFALRANERGWYAFASQVRCTNGGGTQMMVRHGKTGHLYQKHRLFEGPAGLITASEDNMTTFDVMRMDAGDLVKTRVATDAVAGTYAWEGRLTMIQLQKLDV